MEHGAYYARMTMGQLKTVSNDKGPHKIATVEADGKEIDCHICEGFGLQSNPHTDALCLVVFPDGDEGKGLIIAAMPRPKDRVDQQKEGEVTLKNHDTGNSIQHNSGGDTVHTSKQDIKLNSGGEIHLN